MKDQAFALHSGVHIVVATPGKLIDMLEKKRITLDVCRYSKSDISIYLYTYIYIDIHIYVYMYIYVGLCI
jgi:hypothetical protein